MKNLKTYLPPASDVVLLQGREPILDLSQFGEDNAAGIGFGSGNTIDYPITF